MYKVFVVDDEIAIREGIRNSRIWDGGMLTLVGEAGDGEIAYPMIRDERPDIVITDIKMPFMDGMELCRQIHKTMPRTQLVILSGYDNFSYAQQAISYGVQEYLLKPVSSAKLEETLNRIAQRIENERKERVSQEQMYRQMAEGKLLIRNHLLSNVIQTNISQTEGEEICSQLRTFGIDISAKCYTVIEICQKDRKASYDSIRKALSIFEMGHDTTCFLCESGHSLNALVLGDKDEEIEERAYSYARTMQDELECLESVEVRFSIGETVYQVGDLFKSFCSARHTRHVIEANPAICHDRKIMGCKDLQDEEQIRPNNQQDISDMSLYELVRYAEKEEMRSLIARYVESLRRRCKGVMLTAEYLRVETLLAASKIIQSLGGNVGEVLNNNWLEAEVRSNIYLDSYIGTAADILECVAEYRDEHTNMKGNRVVNKARSYMKEHYMDSNLTFQDVVAHVAMSSSHFSTIFAENMGRTFTQYLTELRMEKAKELLTNTNMRSSEIAYAVGYNDPHYFSYLFKKNTGVTPGNYRGKS